MAATPPFPPPFLPLTPLPFSFSLCPSINSPLYSSLPLSSPLLLSTPLSFPLTLLIPSHPLFLLMTNVCLLHIFYNVSCLCVCQVVYKGAHSILFSRQETKRCAERLSPVSCTGAVWGRSVSSQWEGGSIKCVCVCVCVAGTADLIYNIGFSSLMGLIISNDNPWYWCSL